MSNWARAMVVFAPFLAYPVLAQSTSLAPAEPAIVAEPPAGEQALTNADVLALLEAGLPESVVVAKIATASKVRFDTSADTLVALSQSGVPAAVLTAMVQRGSRASPRELALRMNFGGTPCEAPGVFLEQGEEIRALDMVGPARHSSGSAMSEVAGAAIFRATRVFLPGFLPSKTKVTLRGAAATFRITEREPTFLLCLPEFPLNALGVHGFASIDPASTQLVAFRVRKRKDERQFTTGNEGFFGVSEYGIPAKQLRDIAFSEVKPGVYRVRTTQPLKPGEYGFYNDASVPGVSMQVMAAGGLGGRLYAFGVDKK